MSFVKQGTAQAPPPSVAVSSLTSDLIRTLTPVRPLREPALVQQVGVEPTVAGESIAIPVNANLGFADVLLYREQLASVFPVSQDYYPLDSIRTVQQHRARDWVARLTAVPQKEREFAVGEWKSVFFADLAARAGNDTAARRIVDTRIDDLALNPAQKSYVLYKYIAQLADPTQDSARLAQNVVIAELYLKQLHALPTKGYRTRMDSTSVLERQYLAEDTLIVAYSKLGNSKQILGHADRAWAYVLAFGPSERFTPLRRSYYHVAKALMQTPAGRQQIFALSRQFKAVAHRAGTEFASSVSADQRTQASRNIEEVVTKAIRDVESWLALLDGPAPKITAHAWLNTADSIYTTEARNRQFDDGRVHVIMFGDFGSNKVTSVLNRIQHAFPIDVDGLFVTATYGYEGPDMMTPSVEVDWLKDYLCGVRHFVMPMAIWAGNKVQAGFVPEGHYATFQPEETPNRARYHADMLVDGPICVVIDKHGVVRAYQDVRTRQQEIELRRRIQALLDEGRVGARLSSSLLEVD